MKEKVQNLIILMICLPIFVLGAACNKSSPQPAVTTPPQVTTNAKRYALKGKIVSIDKRAKMANIDAEAIPGFMDAMIMPYPVKPETDLDKLQPGDLITGDIVVQDDNSWLENVKITGHQNGAPEK